MTTFFIVLGIIAVLLIVLFIYGTKLTNGKLKEQEELLNAHKMPASIFVIDKKKDKLDNANLPKAVLEQMPKYLKFKKFPLVKAKVGPQIVTLICDDKLFNDIQVKKMMNVEIAGIYIVGIKKGK